MRTKEMTMNDYRAMYAEYCLEADVRERYGIDHMDFVDFVAWRKRAEKYLRDNSDSS